MALTITARGITWTTASGNKTVTATPAVGDLIVIVAPTTTSAAPSASDNNADGLGTYTTAVSAFKNASGDVMRILVRNAPIGSATSTVFTMTPSAGDSGGGLAVISVGGLGSAPGGASSIGATGKQDNQAAATPSITLSATPSSASAIIGAIFDATNGTANSAPPTNFSEHYDQGFNSPATGVEVVSRASGHTSTTVAWTAATPSAFGSAAVEILALQTVSVALLNQAAATFAPTIVQNQTLSVGLIDQTAALFAPSVGREVLPGFINQAATTSAPTVTSLATITVAQIDRTAVAFAPSSFQQQFYTPALLSQAATPFAPTVTTTYGISLALIDRTAAAFDPTVAAGGVGTPTWTTPANGVAMPPGPELKFTIPTAASPMHFNLQLDTVNTFDSGSLRDIRSDLDQTGWAFWDGDSWEPVPAGGVDESYAGNEARYTVSPDLTSTTWYRRVRAGTS